MGLITGAKVIKAEAPKGGRKAAAKPSVEMPGMRRLAAIRAAIDSLKAMAAIEEASIKGAVSAKFIKDGCEIQDRPQNFDGVDGTASGNCQLKIRSTASILSEEEIETLTKAGLTTRSIVTTEEAFMINPDHAENMELLQRIEEALETVKGIPTDFFIKQEKVEVQVASEEAFKAVFKKKAEEVSTLLPIMTTIAIKTVLTEDCFAVLDEIMASPVAAKIEAEEAKA